MYMEFTLVLDDLIRRDVTLWQRPGARIMHTALM